MDDDSDWLAFTDDGIQSTLKEVAEPKHVNFNAGELGDFENAGHPCEQRFLDAIVRDFAVLAYFTRIELSHGIPHRGRLSKSSNLLYGHMDRVMFQCQRLKAAPNLFPSVHSRDSFLSKIGQLSCLLPIVADIATRKCEFDGELSAPIATIERHYTDMVLLNIGQSPTSAEMPHFLPDKIDGGNPWSTWLENSATCRDGWIGIEQKIPRVGDRIIRTLTDTYDAIEHLFEEDELIPHVLDDGHLHIPRPGDEFKHMTWSGFCTMPIHNLHFNSGQRKSYDADGVTTLEYISKKLDPLHESINGYPRARQVISKNCAYFRFAMAYRPDTCGSGGESTCTAANGNH